LHIKYGHQLFAAAEYEQAMVRCLSRCHYLACGDQVLLNSEGARLYLNSLWHFLACVRQVQFGMCSSANPVVLLRLFPSLAPEELLSPVLHLFPGALHQYAL
jgi:hypothetical protein